MPRFYPVYPTQLPLKHSVLKIPHFNKYPVKKIKGILFIYAFAELAAILQATIKIFSI